MPPTKANNGSSKPSPAMLLLDRKAMKKQMANGDSSPKKKSSAPDSTQSRPAYDPRQLLNPKALHSKPGGKKSAVGMASSKTDSPGSDSDGQKRRRDDGGGGNMLEDLYGVERRSERPQKVAKVVMDDDEESVAKPSTSNSSFNISGNGTIGAYMKGIKDEQEEQQSLVDLTNVEDDGDDEIMVTGQKDVGGDIVCYGMLNCSIQAHRVPKPPRSLLETPGYWPQIPCNIIRDPSRDMVIKVTGPDHNEFGRLDPTVSGALAPVMDSSIEGFKAVTQVPLRKKKDNESLPNMPCSDVVPARVTLYGPRRNAAGIGKRFSQKNLWFDKPLFVEKGHVLFNPHADQRRLTGPLGQGLANRTVYSDTRTVEEATTAVSKMFDSLATSDRKLPHMKPSSLITTSLLDHQEQALWFMIEREKARRFGKEESENTSLWREDYKPNGQKIYTEIVSGIKVEREPPQVLGGLLADMMGLGKTIEILSLIASTTSAAKGFSESPVIRAAAEDSKYLRNCKTTLLISPLSAVKNWEDQIREHVKPGGLSYYVYHGTQRTKNAFELGNYDIVIATYGTVAYEVSRQAASPLHKLRWFRIVLDEAHTIRESKTVQSQVIYSLWATRRWAVTGTPIQNRIDDLGSLIKFLRMYPYNEPGKFGQYIKGPIIAGNEEFLKSLRIFVDSFTLRRLKDQIDLPSRDDLVVHLDFSPEEHELHDFFKKEANTKVKIITEKGKGPSYHHILRGISTLRMISAHGKELLNARDKARLRGATKTEAIDLDASPQSREVTEASAYEVLDMMADAGCNTCLSCSKPVVNDPNDGSEDETDTKGIMLSCYDLFCTACFEQFKNKFDDGDESNLETFCPTCTGIVSKKYLELTWEGLDAARLAKEGATADGPKAKRNTYSGPHTKTKALLADLARFKEDSKEFLEKGEPPIKSVVFSEFTSHLDLIARALRDNGHEWVRIDGTMSLNQRRKVLTRFDEDPETTVLLASIKAAGQGLNLTAASRAYIMEPLWNPAAEQQAVDRVHRLGQTRPVIITRFIMKDSIEERIRDMQVAKNELSNISMGHKSMTTKEQREESIKMMKSLFK